ncbi:MAG: signal peptidase [Nocardioides sp.]|nr:signal peptidase [Nocardioides sp.]
MRPPSPLVGRVTMRKLAIWATSTVLLGVLAGLLTGTLALVETYGNSMEPRMVAGDLVLVRASSTYEVGDVVAYTSPELDRTVLHRVTAVHGDGTHTFRGDNTNFDDPERPTQRDFIGKELLHVPGGGIWTDRLSSPVGVAIVAFAVLASGGTAVDARRRRTKRTRKTHMAQHVAPGRSVRPASGWSPPWRTTAAVAAAVLCVGLALGVTSWTRPTAKANTAAGPVARSVTFSYQADVPRSPAYDATRVTEPDPIFRRLTDEVTVRYAYQGTPGAASLAAELSTSSGWHARVPLLKRVSFDTSEHTATVSLDLDRLERKAFAAAEAIGIPATQVDIAVVPTITTQDGAIFAPALRFALTPLQLSLPGGPSSLVVTEPTTTTMPGSPAGSLRLAGYDVPVASARALSAALIVGALVLLILVGLVQTRRTAGEAADIRRRYASILLPVEPMTSPTGRPTVDVTDFAALAKLSERYGLMVMYWTRANVDTFTVHDDGITYRYRTNSSSAPADGSRGPTSTTAELRT